MLRIVTFDIFQCRGALHRRCSKRVLLFFCCFFALMATPCLATPPQASGAGAAADLPATWSKELIHDPEFNGQVLLVQTGKQHRQTIILLHGLGKNGLRDWVDVIKRLETRFHVLAFDLPGFGGSSAEPGRYTPTRYAQVLKNIADRHAHSRPYIVGHSLGGAVALRFAGRYPQQVERLILVDAAGILERTAFLKHNTALPVNGNAERPAVLQRALESVDYLRGTLIEQTGFIPDPMNAAYHNSNAWEWLVSDSPNTNAAYALVAENFAEAVFTMPVPTFIVWGAADRVAPLRTGKLLARRLPQAQLEVIEDAGHVPMQSHVDVFMQYLEPALAPRWQPLPAGLFAAGAEPAADDPVQDVRCDHRGDVTYSGRYRQVLVNGCRKVTLRDLQAEKIVIQHSEVVMENVAIQSPDVGLETLKGMVVATNVDIRARIGIRTNASRLDLAGFEIDASEVAMQGQRKSRVIVSASKFTSPIYQGYAHGAYSLKLGILDQRLKAGGQSL